MTQQPENDDRQVRPFAELLTSLDGGAAHAEASRLLNDLVFSVQGTGKPGSITITVKLAPLKGSANQLVAQAVVAAKPPKSEPSAAVFFVDDTGNLTRHDPRQLQIDGLRVVEPKAARTVTPGSN